MAVSPPRRGATDERAAPPLPSRGASRSRLLRDVWGSRLRRHADRPRSTRRRSPTSAFATRIAFAVALLAFGLRARWPTTRAEWGHVAVAGLLSHAGYLGGSHYAQRWGLSAGVTALILALQPLLTALIVSRWLHERLRRCRSSASASASAASRSSSAHRVDGAAIARRACSPSSGRSPASPAARSTSASSAPTVDLRAAVCIHFAVDGAA